MSRISIPLDAITSRLNLQGRFDSVRSQSLTSRFANLRPISEFLDLKRVSKPQNFSEVQARVNYNLGHFSSNYAVVFVMLSIYSLLTNLLLLFVIFLVVGGMWGIGRLDGRDLELGFTRATTSQLYTSLLVVAVPLGFWASPISTVLWLIGATGTYRECFFRGGGLGGRPRTPYSVPHWGRPSGASVGKKRRRWEEEQRRLWEEHQRFEELETDDDDNDEHVGLGITGQRRGFTSDELHFTGGDISSRRQSKSRFRRAVDTSSSSESTQVSEEGDAGALQVALRSKEDMYVQTALARIERARAKGKRSVNLTELEIQALERKGQLPNVTRAARRSEKSSSGSSDSDQVRRSKNKQLEPRSTASGPSSRRNRKSKPRYEESPPLPTGYAYPPVGRFSPPGNSRSRSPSSGTGPEPRSYPEPVPHYEYQRRSRYFSNPEEAHALVRPRSSREPPARPTLPDDPDWYPPTRSRSAAQMYAPEADPFQYQTYSPSTQHLPRRRPVPASPEIQYSQVIRRLPASNYPASGSAASASDPTLIRRLPVRGSEQEESSTSSTEEDSTDKSAGVEEAANPDPIPGPAPARAAQVRSRGAARGRRGRGRR
ncbi:MAG: hypothetical protein M1825_004737 [Sarcosagium campestre]|nr:MAG: hypothetical protein M1825_004737 [Sarcosagium campestre]